MGSDRKWKFFLQSHLHTHRCLPVCWRSCGKVQGQLVELPELFQLLLLCLQKIQITTCLKWLRQWVFPLWSVCSVLTNPGGWVLDPEAASERTCPSAPARSSPWWSARWWTSRHHYMNPQRSYHTPEPSRQPPAHFTRRLGTMLDGRVTNSNHEETPNRTSMLDLESPMTGSSKDRTSSLLEPA